MHLNLIGGSLVSKEFINELGSMFPVLPLRGLVVFPGMTLHFDIGRKKSLLALNEAMNNDQYVFLVTQKDMKTDSPKGDQLYSYGVIAQIKQILRQPGNVIKISVEGKCRAKVKGFVFEDPFIKANIISFEEKKILNLNSDNALIRKTKELFAEYIRLSPKMPSDLIAEVKDCKDMGKLADIIASNIILDYKEKQVILSEIDQKERLENLTIILANELDILYIEEDINLKLRENIDKNQREYYLKEQIRVINQELGEDDNPQQEANELMSKIRRLGLPAEEEEQLTKECNRLSKMPVGSHEANVIISYLNTCINLPWNKLDDECLDLDKAQEILDKDHYGLKKVKERIIELLAVRKLSPDIKGQVICLVGPPGVGKTSVANSIAKAMGRKYIRISLGGVRDESDIRGHRRTYIGAMPGRIMAAMGKSGTRNPLILLDEVDKMGKSFQGDPTSAMLEVFDAEQNCSFHDHYIDMPFDLSDVLFITTANDYNAIPEPLLDRMEVITLSSYSYEEKFSIAKLHLIPKQLKKHGINKDCFKITDEALKTVIEGYTREAGVRGLERKIAAIMRKSAKAIASEEKLNVNIDVANLEEMLGTRKFKRDNLEKEDLVGIAKGLAWTAVGGEVMPIEVAVMLGTGKIELTGSLGDVMKESAHIAISYIRSHADELGIDPKFYKSIDIHIHAPEGAIPKDGPSAGITMATSLVSALTKIAVKSDIAMTGELTLSGKILPIGGLKEKTMAAYKAGVNKVIIPKSNRADLSDIDSVVKNSLDFIFVDKLTEVFEIALADSLARKKYKNKNILPEKVGDIISTGKKDVYSADINMF